MSFDDLTDQFRLRKKVRVMFNGHMLNELETTSPVLRGQQVCLEMNPKPGSGAVPIREVYYVTKLEYEGDTVIAHVQLSKENV